MTKIECPTCHLRYWDYEKALQCCDGRRKKEDAETQKKRDAQIIAELTGSVRK